MVKRKIKSQQDGLKWADTWSIGLITLARSDEKWLGILG